MTSAQLRRGAWARSRARSAGVGDRAAELGDERRLVAGLEEQAAAAVVERVLVDLQPRGDGHRPRGGGAAQQAGRGREPLRGGDEHVGRAQERVDVLLAGVGEAHPAAHGGAQRRRGRRSARGDDRRLPGQVGVERGAGRAGRGAGPRAPPRRRAGARRRRRRGPGRPPGRRRPARGRRSAPGRRAPRAVASPRSRPGGRRGAPGRGGPASARPGRRRAARAARGSRRRSARASGAARRSTTLGAKGSWTWQRSSASCSKRASSVRATSIGIARPPARPPARRPSGGSASPTARTRNPPAPSSPEDRNRPSPPARTARRPSRTSAADDEGATTATRCPRPTSSRATAATYRLASWPDSHGYGVTWAIARLRALLTVGSIGARTTCGARGLVRAPPGTASVAPGR